MRALLLILVTLLLAVTASAGILKVASDGTQAYSQISDAITVSSANDTILVMAGGYNGFTVDRRLVIIGAGTGAGIGEGVLVAGIITVLDAADSTELRSLAVRFAAASTVDSLSAVVRIRSGASRVFLWRCFLENNSSSNHKTMVSVGYYASADLVQCVLWNSSDVVSDYSYGLQQRSNSSVTVSSTALVNLHYAFYRNSTITSAGLMVRHCVFTCTGTTAQIAFYTEATGIAENCAFLTGSSTQTWTNCPNMSFSYCAWNLVAPPGATHVQTTAAAFTSLLLTDARASDFHLAAGSNLLNAGNPGSPDDLDGSRADIGLYGGQHPHVDGGVPDYPFAVQVEVPYSAPLNGTMRIWGRGRVGPGY